MLRVAKNIFWNDEQNRLRAFWRICAQAALMAVIALAPVVLIGEMLTTLRRHGLFLTAMNDELFDKIANFIVGPIFTVLVIVSVWLAGRRLDHRRFADFGVHLHRCWWSDLGVGLALGAVLMGFIFGVEYAAGWVKITGTLQKSSADLTFSLALCYALVKALCVGNYEEFFSRGYHLKNLAEGFHGIRRAGAKTAVMLSAGVSSIIFALLHVSNDNTTILSTLGIFVNGLLLATGYVATGELAIPIGLHIAWNFFQGSVFGFPVSGDKEGATLLAIQQSGPLWITGGAFGPEAGLLGMAMMIMGDADLICSAKEGLLIEIDKSYLL